LWQSFVVVGGGLQVFGLSRGEKVFLGVVAAFDLIAMPMLCCGRRTRPPDHADEEGGDRAAVGA